MMFEGSIMNEEIQKYIEFKKKYNTNLIKYFYNDYLKDIKNIKGLELKKNYKKILNNIKKLYVYFDYNDPFYISCFYMYLVWNGYLSHDKKFSFSYNRQADFVSLEGIDVILGKGNCLNLSAFLTDSLTSNGIDAYSLACFIPDNLENISYKTKSVKQNIHNKNKKLLQNFFEFIYSHHIKNSTGNHAVTTFKKDNSYYIADPTALAFLYYDKFLVGKYYGNNKNINIFAHPMLASKDVNPKNFFDKINKLKQYENKYNKKIINEIFKEVIKTSDKNKKILDDFYNFNKTIYNNIKEEVYEYKKIKK